MVSPLDIEGTAQAMGQAINMPHEQRGARLAEIRAKVHSWTAAHWLSAQLDALHQVSPSPSHSTLTGALKRVVAPVSRFNLAVPDRHQQRAGRLGRRSPRPAIRAG